MTEGTRGAILAAALPMLAAAGCARAVAPILEPSRSAVALTGGPAASGSDTVHAYLVPGHTPGTAVYLFRGVRFLGDAVTRTSGMGFGPARARFSDDPELAARNLELLRRRLPTDRVRYACTGHAHCAPFTPEFVEQMRRNTRPPDGDEPHALPGRGSGSPTTLPPSKTMQQPEARFRGIYTAIYRVPDITEAKSWYARAFGIAPYFDEPFYVGFDIGGWELGLQPESGEARAGAGGVVAYWGVADAAEALAWLLSIGASRHAEVQDVGGGIRVAAVRDPYGNVLGIIENPNFRHGRR